MPDPFGRPVPTDPDTIVLQRGRVLDGLAGSAWHELSQPLGGLRGFVTVLQMEGWSTEQLGVDPKLIEEATADTERLARAFTDLARGSSRAVPLRSLVGDILALAGHLLMDVEVTVQIPADTPEVDVDPAALRVAVASLLLDSLRALGGPRWARGRLRWEATPAAGLPMLVLRLEDSAPTGVPPDLGIVRSLLAAEGATLAHEAPGGTGNRYTITLPMLDVLERAGAAGTGAASGARVTGGSETTDEDAPPSDADGAGRLTVLVCDDEEPVRRLLVRVVERMGHRALQAGSGTEALAHLDREPVHVVMTDHHMAGMTGLQLHDAAVARRPALRGHFVLISGDAHDPELVQFARSHDLVVLWKPFDIRGLPGTIREVAAR